MIYIFSIIPQKNGRKKEVDSHRTEMHHHPHHAEARPDGELHCAICHTLVEPDGT
jgi:hypothetical protein